MQISADLLRIFFLFFNYDIKGSGSRDKTHFFTKCIVFGLDKNLYSFWISKMLLFWAIAFYFFQRLGWKQILNNLRCLQNRCLSLSNIVLKWPHLNFNRFLLTGKTYSNAKISTLFCGPPRGFYQTRKFLLELEQWTNRNIEFIQWNNRKQGGEVSNLAASSNKYYFSYMFSPLPCGKWLRRQLIRNSFLKFRNM
jgi:hypothetical protein